MFVNTILINGGELRAGEYKRTVPTMMKFLLIGSPTSPFNGSVEIILTGNTPPNPYFFGNFPILQQSRMIGVLGLLSLHGAVRTVTWTRLAQTASAGSNLIILNTPVDWQIGDEIIITTTDTSLSHTERHRIALMENGTNIRTVASLLYDHRVIQQTLGGRTSVDVAAAVGLLTRNVRIINQMPSSAYSGFRIVVSVNQTSSFIPNRYTANTGLVRGSARLSNVQFIGFGRFDDSAYSDQYNGIYLNQLGNFSTAQLTYIDRCSFDGGYNGA